MKTRGGFTVVEGMIVVLILGIVLAIIIPNVMAAHHLKTGPAMRLRYIHPDEPLSGLARIDLPAGTRLVISERRRAQPSGLESAGTAYRQLKGSDGMELYVPEHALDGDESEFDRTYVVVPPAGSGQPVETLGVPVSAR